jgi:hypothetical protein
MAYATLRYQQALSRWKLKIVVMAREQGIGNREAEIFFFLNA